MQARSMTLALIAGLAVAPAAAAQDAELGKKVYGQRCGACHGADGKGNAKMATSLKVTIPDLTTLAGKSEADLTKAIAEGKKPMPAYEKTLKPEEMKAVVAYVKSLAKP